MKAPDDLLYSKEHEWIQRANDVATIGITEHAQKELGDVVFAESNFATSKRVASD